MTKPAQLLFLIGLLGLSVSAAVNAAPAPVASSAQLVRSHSPIIGPANAPVTIVEFFDPSCEACSAMHPIVKRIMAEFPNDVRLVIRYVPLHKGSDEAIRILEAARAQGIFEPVLEMLLIWQSSWHDGGMASAWDSAQASGLDRAKAKAVLDSKSVSAALAVDAADRKAFEVKGTPTFFVNGKRLEELSPQRLYELVKSEVEASKK